MTYRSWVTHESRLLLERARFDVVSDRVTTPAGTAGRYDWIDAGDQVRVAAVADGLVYLVEQAHYLLPGHARIWQLPGGGVDDGEDPQIAAARELREETGVTAATTWTSLGAVYPLPGLTRVRAHLVLAEGLTGGRARPEESEADLSVVRLPVAEALGAVLDGRIACAASALLVLALAAGAGGP